MGSQIVQHIERRAAHRAANHAIPEMTDPMGRYWDQPDRSLIEVDDTHALMSLRTFRELKEYSASNPSGVYPGKMWKQRQDGIYDREFLALGGKQKWLLCWYGLSEKGPGWCSICHRTVRLLDADIESVDE